MGDNNKYTTGWHDSPGYFDLIRSCLHTYRNAWRYGEWKVAHDELDTWFRSLPFKDNEEKEEIKELLEETHKLIEQRSQETESYLDTNWGRDEEQKIKEKLHDIYEKLHSFMHKKNMWTVINQKQDPGKVLSQTRYG